MRAPESPSNAAQPKILYADNHLIVAYKPAGLLTQGDASGAPNLLDHVKDWLARTYDKPGRVYLGLLHRLDRPVSGLIVFARTSKAAARMSRLFRERRVEKIYRARVEGLVEPARGELVHHLAPDEAGHGARVGAASPNHKPARLTYRRLFAAARSCVVEVRLDTGRKHQIRAQFGHIGHPVMGDVRYGARRRYEGPGIALCAVRLGFEHPVTKQRLDFELPLQLWAVGLSQAEDSR